MQKAGPDKGGEPGAESVKKVHSGEYSHLESLEKSPVLHVEVRS